MSEISEIKQLRECLQLAFERACRNGCHATKISVGDLLLLMNRAKAAETELEAERKDKRFAIAENDDLHQQAMRVAKERELAEASVLRLTARVNDLSDALQAAARAAREA